jgi:hypothetical protein
MSAPDQWPSAGRMVHVTVGTWGHLPAVILDMYDPKDQPVTQIRVQAFPVNEFPKPLYLDSTRGEWHWPEYVGPKRGV